MRVPVPMSRCSIGLSASAAAVVAAAAAPRAAAGDWRGRNVVVSLVFSFPCCPSSFSFSVVLFFFWFVWL